MRGDTRKIPFGRMLSTPSPCSRMLQPSMEERPMKHNRHRSLGKPRVSPTVLDRINPNVAGIDCGAAEHFVAVPPDRDPMPVQSFHTFTGDLLRLAEWLTAISTEQGSRVGDSAITSAEPPSASSDFTVQPLLSSQLATC